MDQNPNFVLKLRAQWPKSVVCWSAAAFIFLFALISLPGPVSAQDEDFETRAARAILLDIDSESVLYEKNADATFAPGNMAKLMTLAVVFDAIKNQRVSLSTPFKVSENAWRTGGAPSGKSTMFAEIHSEVAVRDLIKGAVIHYGNDGYIALAEGLAGTERSFSGLMNDLAADLGMTNSNFTNATGDVEAGMVTSARDMARLALYLRKQHPGLYRIFSSDDFEWNGIYQRNRNPMIGLNMGADGLITSYIEDAGYGLVTSTERDNRRQIVVLSGLETPAQRVLDARRAINFGMRAFEPLVVFQEGTQLGQARVFGGEDLYVTVVGDGEIRALLPRDGGARLSAQVRYNAPLVAPVEKGQQIGILEVIRDGQVARVAPVYAGETVEVGTLTDRAFSSVIELAVQVVVSIIPDW